jgi:hypothetical protein
LVVTSGLASNARAQESKSGSGDGAGITAVSLAELYEHLANSIIEIRATEDNLVKAMLVQYHVSAQQNLAAAAASATGRAAHLEAAAENIASIAQEGDKRARAVRQRLSDAGHYHQKDAETKEDYMFINSKEKQSLLALAKRVGQLGNSADAAEIKKAGDELRAQFGKAIGRE